MPVMESLGRQDEDHGGLLIPVLPMDEGPPDASTVAAWHLALSNLLATELPHELLALWTFPDRGGVILLAPTELEQDRLAVPVPNPRLSQDQLFALEERVRTAGYRSAVAVPVRGPERDLGLALFAALSPGVYGISQALRLHGLFRDLVPTFTRLAHSPPLPLPSEEGVPDDLASRVVRAALDARTGPELLRLVSGALATTLPHERIEIAIPGAAEDRWALVSGRPEGQRWGDLEGMVQASEAVEKLVSVDDGSGFLSIHDLQADASATTWPTYTATRSSQRVRSVLGIHMSVAGEPAAWLFLGGARAGMFGTADREQLESIGPIVALRVHGLRAALNTQVGRAQLSAMKASQPSVARLVTLLASTPHWGEATTAFAEAASRLLGYATIRFVLRVGGDRMIRLEPGDPRPLTTLPSEGMEFSEVGGLLSGRAPFLVFGDQGEHLAVPLRLASRPVGALELRGGSPGAAGHPVAEAQQLADVIAPHLELLRRSAFLDQPGQPKRRPDPKEALR